MNAEFETEVYFLPFYWFLQQEDKSEEVTINLFEDALTEWTKPPYISKREQLEKEGDIYGYPSTFPGKNVHQLLSANSV